MDTNKSFINDINDRMKGEYCANCPLREEPFVRGMTVMDYDPKYATNEVYGIAPRFISESRYPNVMIVGRDPGKHETQKRQPFIGVSGMLLRATLRRLGLTYYYLTNVCKCRPPGNKSNRVAGMWCRRFLINEIQLINPRRVILLGRDAYYWVMMTHVRPDSGEEVYRDDTIRFYYAHHPSYVVRNGMKASNWEKQLEQILDGII